MDAHFVKYKLDYIEEAECGNCLGTQIAHLMPEDKAYKLPIFTICFTCHRIHQVGVGFVNLPKPVNTVPAVSNFDTKGDNNGEKSER